MTQSHKNPGPSVSEIRGGKLYAPDPYCWNDLNHTLSYRRHTPWSSALNGDCTGICDMNRSDVPPFKGFIDFTEKFAIKNTSL